MRDPESVLYGRIYELEAINAELLAALEGLLADSVILSQEYLYAFDDWPTDSTIQGWEKARWLRALAASKKAQAAIANAKAINQ